MWMNVACLVGRATSEPRRKTTAGGTEYVTLRVAVRRSSEHTDFFTVELWGRLANVALNHVTTGRMLSLRCELQQHEWGAGEDRRERISLVVRKLGLLGSSEMPMPEMDAA
jgi:single-strand DNA-binding protein